MALASFKPETTARGARMLRTALGPAIRRFLEDASYSHEQRRLDQLYRLFVRINSWRVDALSLASLLGLPASERRTGVGTLRRQ